MENTIARTVLLEQSRPTKRGPLDESCLEKFLLPASALGLFREESQVSVCVWLGFLWLFCFLASPGWEPEVLGCPSAEGRKEEWVCRVLGPCGPKERLNGRLVGEWD